MDLDEVADELYEVPPEEFIALRKERQDEAKADGDKALAKEIGALPKPSAAAWVCNLLVREHREEIENLVELGTLLREAQENLAGDQLKALDVAAAAAGLRPDPAGARTGPRARPSGQHRRWRRRSRRRCGPPCPTRRRGRRCCPAGSPRRCPTAAWGRRCRGRTCASCTRRGPERARAEAAGAARRHRPGSPRPTGDAASRRSAGARPRRSAERELAEARAGRRGGVGRGRRGRGRAGGAPAAGRGARRPAQPSCRRGWTSSPTSWPRPSARWPRPSPTLKREERRRAAAEHEAAEAVEARDRALARVEHTGAGPSD